MFIDKMIRVILTQEEIYKLSFEELPKLDIQDQEIVNDFIIDLIQGSTTDEGIETVVPFEEYCDISSNLCLVDYEELDKESIIYQLCDYIVE